MIKKPEDIIRKKEYEARKIESNKLRAIGGGLRHSDETSNLPPNIYNIIKQLIYK